MNAADLIERKLGVKVGVEENPVVAEVGTASIRIVNQDPNRLFLMIMNLSANKIWVKVGLGASATKGILLGPNGDSVTFSIEEDFVLAAREFTAIADGANSAIYVLAGTITGDVRGER